MKESIWKVSPEKAQRISLFFSCSSSFSSQDFASSFFPLKKRKGKIK